MTAAAPTTTATYNFRVYPLGRRTFPFGPGEIVECAECHEPALQVSGQYGQLHEFVHQMTMHGTEMDVSEACFSVVKKGGKK